MLDDARVNREPMHVDLVGTRLSADRWAGTGPTLVLLHAGVTDRRGWYATAERLTGLGTVVSYDRRGFGDSPVSVAPYRDLEDLFGVLDQVTGAPAWLMGSSMGGGLALDAALAHPDRIAGLVLLAPAVSGAPDPVHRDPHTPRLRDLINAADAAGDLEEVNRLEAWLWLDGPAGPEHRVAGPARELALAMNATILENEAAEDATENAGVGDVEAWQRLEEVQAPTTVAWGELDVPFLIDRCEQLTVRLPHARRRVLPGTAHLPYLEQPDLVADLIHAAVTLA